MMKINLTLFILLGLFLVVALGVPALKKRNTEGAAAFLKSLDGEWTGYSDKFCASGAYITIIFANEGQDVSMAATAVVDGTQRFEVITSKVEAWRADEEGVWNLDLTLVSGTNNRENNAEGREDPLKALGLFRVDPVLSQGEKMTLTFSDWGDLTRPMDLEMGAGVNWIKVYRKNSMPLAL